MIGNMLSYVLGCAHCKNHDLRKIDKHVLKTLHITTVFLARHFTLTCCGDNRMLDFYFSHYFSLKFQNNAEKMALHFPTRCIGIAQYIPHVGRVYVVVAIVRDGGCTYRTTISFSLHR